MISDTLDISLALKWLLIQTLRTILHESSLSFELTDGMCRNYLRRDTPLLVGFRCWHGHPKVHHWSAAVKCELFSTRHFSPPGLEVSAWSRERFTILDWCFKTYLLRHADGTVSPLEIGTVACKVKSSMGCLGAFSEYCETYREIYLPSLALSTPPWQCGALKLFFWEKLAEVHRYVPRLVTRVLQGGSISSGPQGGHTGTRGLNESSLSQYSEKPTTRALTLLKVSSHFTTYFEWACWQLATMWIFNFYFVFRHVISNVEFRQRH